MFYAKPLAKLVTEFEKLPGIGPKSAQRLAFHVLRLSEDEARALAEAEGYGPGFKFFTHRLGHGLGMDGHEWPYLVEHNMYGWTKTVTLKPGMTFTNEPGIYIPGEFGIRLEDDMVITENGAELFTPQSPSIDDPFPGLPVA